VAHQVGGGLALTRVADPGRGAPPYELARRALQVPSRTPGRTPRLVFLGAVDLTDTRPPWTYLERMGDAHFASTAGYRVTLVEHHPRPLVTVVKLWAEPA
jgi:hypothetical protein